MSLRQDSAHVQQRSAPAQASSCRCCKTKEARSRDWKQLFAWDFHCRACRDLARSTMILPRRGVGKCARSVFLRPPQATHSSSRRLNRPVSNLRVRRVGPSYPAKLKELTCTQKITRTLRIRDSVVTRRPVLEWPTAHHSARTPHGTRLRHIWTIDGHERTLFIAPRHHHTRVVQNEPNVVRGTHI